MSQPLYDAHTHSASQLEPRTSYAVINSTGPDNWSQLLESIDDSNTIAAIGLHPWRVNDSSDDWQTQFVNFFENGAQAVGEIGLDKWIKGYDIDTQIEAFRWQMAFAAERNLPVSIHCLKASDLLLRTLREIEIPLRGFHLHAYSGPAEQVAQLTELGAYFSFHAGQLTEKARRAPEAVRAVPTERLLIETDAPDTLKHGTDYEAFLKLSYTKVSEIRGETLDKLAKQVEANFKTYFPHAGS